MTMRIETLEDVAEVRRWLSEHVVQGNALARRCLRILDAASPGTEIATARMVVDLIFRINAQSDTLLRRWYEAAGAPYGDSEEGLARWDAEQRERERQRRGLLN